MSPLVQIKSSPLEAIDATSERRGLVQGGGKFVLVPQ